MADRVTVGDAEIIAVIDMVPPPREPSAMFPDVPTDAWTLTWRRSSLTASYSFTTAASSSAPRDR